MWASRSNHLETQISDIKCNHWRKKCSNTNQLALLRLGERSTAMRQRSREMVADFGSVAAALASGRNHLETQISDIKCNHWRKKCSDTNQLALLRLGERSTAMRQRSRLIAAYFGSFATALARERNRIDDEVSDSRKCKQKEKNAPRYKLRSGCGHRDAGEHAVSAKPGDGRRFQCRRYPTWQST